jgi:hypothetical protein
MKDDRCVGETSIWSFGLSRPTLERAVAPAALFAGALTLLVAAVVPGTAAGEVRVAEGWQVEVVVTGIVRPIQLAFARPGSLVILTHGAGGEAAAEVFSLDLAQPLPVDASRSPRIVIPFARGPRKTAFGSLAIAPGSGDVYLGEENGNRVYRLTPGPHLVPVAVGLRHLVGGSSLAFDARGRLLLLDYASPETALRAETALPPELDWLAAEAYRGPLVFRVEIGPTAPLPRRLDFVPPLYPRGWVTGGTAEILSRFMSLVAAPAGDVLLLDSLGQVFRLDAEGLRGVARLPGGHYHRTNLALAPDGGLLVSTGFHVRILYRVSPDGALSVVATELGDPSGVVVDAAGWIYVAETALHRIIRIRPAAGR